MTHPIVRKGLKLVQKFALRGDQVYCPLCEKGFVTFLPYGVRKRANAQCPNCYSLERHRLIWLFMKEKGILGRALKMLHVSPEIVFFDKFKRASEIDYVPIDKFDPGYTYPKGTQNADITALPYPDASFDFILCIHVLEHVPDDALAMRELLRVLKSDGCAIIQVPLDKHLAITQEDLSITDPVMRQKLYGQPDHVRQYGLDYEQRLIAAGFKVEVNKFDEKFSSEEKFKLGLPIDEDIYFCTKP
jgi:SAM-dependent methyltransferase